MREEWCEAKLYDQEQRKVNIDDYSDAKERKKHYMRRVKERERERKVNERGMRQSETE